MKLNFLMYQERYVNSTVAVYLCPRGPFLALVWISSESWDEGLKWSSVRSNGNRFRLLSGAGSAAGLFRSLKRKEGLLRLLLLEHHSPKRRQETTFPCWPLGGNLPLALPLRARPVCPGRREPRCRCCPVPRAPQRPPPGAWSGLGHKSEPSAETDGCWNTAPVQTLSSSR